MIGGEGYRCFRVSAGRQALGITVAAGVIGAGALVVLVLTVAGSGDALGRLAASSVQSGLAS